MQLKIEKGTFKDYSLEDISDALKKGLSENFKKVEVEVVDCPNLRDWDCPSEGISGNQKIIDVGGEPYMRSYKSCRHWWSRYASCHSILKFTFWNCGDVSWVYCK